MRCSVLLGVLALLVSCGKEEAPLPGCETPPSFSAELRPGVVANKCLPCHSETKVGADRRGAPADLNFDRLELFAARQADFVDAITSGREPPSQLAPELAVLVEERDLVDRWRICGYSP
ncbi:MAG: hypothetical protein IT384_33330 [Deltaproteobacteria bacterium]|nr:hypothetical protein [Deltaproteobacteria bacterium]